MRLCKATARDASRCSLWEHDSSSMFYFGAHFTVLDNNEERVTEDRSISAL